MMPAPTATSINHLDTLAIPLRTIGEDQAIYVARDTVLVSSKSERGTFRLVNLAESSCTCPGFFHRNICRHLTVARVCEEIEEREATPILPEYVEPITPLVWMGSDRGFCSKGAI